MCNPLQIAIIIVAAVVIIGIVHAVINRLTKRMAAKPAGPIMIAGQDPAYAAARKAARVRTVGSVANSAAKVAVWVLAACLILERCGVNVGLMIASIGVVGVGLGLGAQSLIKDMLAGIFMIVEDQYGLGDTIDIGPATGVVEAMSLRVTTLRDADGVLWYVPNGTVARIGNKSQVDVAGASAPSA
jgi:small conductance mechanosensitive channel